MSTDPSALAAPEKLLLTPEEAARRLGLSRTQIFRLIASKRLRSVKIGKLRRISRAALEEFVAETERLGVA
jgi:excisionase family DNA binding protein